MMGGVALILVLSLTKIILPTLQNYSIHVYGPNLVIIVACCMPSVFSMHV